MGTALRFAAIVEISTGVALLVVPSLVGTLLLGEEIAGVALPTARIAGIALIALGIACWPGSPLLSMIVYGGAVTVYLAYLGLIVGSAGILLWPAVVLHVIVTAALAYDFSRKGRT